MGKNRKEIFLDPLDSDIEHFEYLLSSLKQGLSLSSPLEILLDPIISGLLRLSQVVNRGIKVKAQAVEVRKRKPSIMGNQPREYELDYSYDKEGNRRPEPLTIATKDVVVLDPTTGFPNVILSENDEYQTRRMGQGPGIHPDAQAFFEDLATVLEQWSHVPYKDPYLYVIRELFGADATEVPSSGYRPKDSASAPPVKSMADAAYKHRDWRRRNRL